MNYKSANLKTTPPATAGRFADRYQDTISGAKASRPELNRLMADARVRKLGIVLCWKLDRFGRSLRDCLNNLEELDSHAVLFIATTQGLDTDNCSPASRFLLQVLGAAAEFERELIRERSAAEKPSPAAPGRTYRHTGPGESSAAIQ